jgi:hypothetical protein
MGKGSLGSMFSKELINTVLFGGPVAFIAGKSDRAPHFLLNHFVFFFLYEGVLLESFVPKARYGVYVGLAVAIVTPTVTV